MVLPTPRNLLPVLALLLPLTVGTIAPATAQDGGEGRQRSPTVMLWQPGDPGQRLNLMGRVMGSDGRPLAGATVSLWQADGTGSYQQDRYRGSFQAGADGGFRLATVLPGQYYGAKHIHVVVEQPGYQSLRTRIVFKGDPYVDESGRNQIVAILEEVRAEDETILVGGVELIMQPLGGG